jgi:hypothetical protein
VTDRYLLPATDADESSALPEWRTPAHPILMGLGAMALAVAAWHGLLWRMDHRPDDGVTGALPSASREAEIADGVTPDTAESRLVVATVPATDSSTALSSPPRPTPAPAPAGTQPTDSAVTRRKSPAPQPAPASVSDEPPLSPFRRSHPWAAVPGQRYYYPTRCPATLRFPDLLFFKTQAEARANGFVPAPDSGCG